MFCSEFEELEAVPNPSTIEGPLEPTMSSSTTVPDTSDEVLANFFIVCYILPSFHHLLLISVNKHVQCTRKELLCASVAKQRIMLTGT
jgi:hypothetical protein